MIRRRHMFKRTQAQRGSAIIMLFVAVGLFAALAFAFMQNSQTSTSFVTEEQAGAYAQQIISYGNSLSLAAKRMTLGGCEDEQISFENGTAAGYENPDAPALCKIFNVAGGGQNYQETPKAALDVKWQNPFFGMPFFTGTAHVSGVGRDCADSSCAELLLLISDLSLPVCRHINKTLGIQDDMPQADGITNYYPQAYAPTKFVGAYEYVNAGSVLGETAHNIAGKKAGCFYNNASGLIPTYFQVILAR